MRKLMIAFMVAVAACGGGGDSPTATTPGGTTPGGTTPTPTPTLDMSLSVSSISVQQGASGTVAVTIVRGGGLTANADLTIEGAPAGVTASFSPASLTGSVLTSTLTLNAASTATVATTGLTVRAKATGVTDKTAPLSLAITAATVTPAGSYTLSAAPAALTVGQGLSGTSTINITRLNAFAGTVNLAVTGAPAGLTATLGTTAATGATSVLSLAAAASTTPGSYTLTITGTATGLPNQTTTVAVTVAAAQTSTGNVTFSFCASTLPIWFAVQDGSGAWTRVTGGANNEFKFNVNSANGGVAYVTNTNGSFTMFIFLQTQAELIAQGQGQCLGGASKTFTGTVAGVTGTDAATIAMAGVSTTASQTTPGFTLAGVAGGAQDLFATNAGLTLSGTSFQYQLKKMIIRRGLNLTDKAVLPVLDFNAAEAFAPATATLTVNNAGADQIIQSMIYYTAGGSAGAISNDVSSGASRTIYGVPAAKQLAGDLHGLAASTFTLSGTTVNSLRVATVFFKDLTNKTLTMGAVPGVATVTSVATSPVARLRAQWAVQSDYNKYFTAVYVQPVGATSRNVTVAVTPGYLGNSANVDFTIPDLSAVAGWDSNWGLRAGVSTTWALGSSGWSFTSLSGQNPIEGGTLLSGQRLGTITP